MQEGAGPGGSIAFALIYLTFFLDNVLLTVLVPIIPDWVSGEALALWAQQAPPLAALLNETVHRAARHQQEGVPGTSQLVVGLVLGAKAAAQLVSAPFAAALVGRRGAAAVLRAATAMLAAAALGLAACSWARGASAAVCVCGARAAHGAGAALAGVAGLALAAAALPHHRRHRGIGALLGAVALGVLVGYPLGGAVSALWSRATPFLVVGAALLADLAMQYMFLDREEYNRPLGGRCAAARSPLAAWREARAGAVGACAGCVLVSTCALAALEPCLPLWLARTAHAPRWQAGAAFLPDSLGYLLATSAAGPAQRLGAERVAITAQLALGLGLGAADAALVPALLARGGRRAARAALLQGAGAAAYALGPALGGALAAARGFPTMLRVLSAANLLYAVYLYTRLRAYPISEQWGASSTLLDSEDEDSSEAASLEGTPLTGLGLDAVQRSAVASQ